MLPRVTMGDPRAYISSLKLPAIERAALAACDASDGVKDGIISDPAKCHFDPAVLLCKGADSLDCLTQPQVDSLKKFYAGGVDGHGKSIFPGYSMGDESGAWRDWVLGQGPGAGSGVQYVQNYFRYMVTGNTEMEYIDGGCGCIARGSKQRNRGRSGLDQSGPEPVCKRAAAN